jgi:hypothetical protein
MRVSLDGVVKAFGPQRVLDRVVWEADFEQGNKAAQQIRVCYLKFPPNQR